MRRIGRYLTIACYLGVLVFGLARHTLLHRSHDHIGMYFVVWDMYCGWTAWETRNHILAQGESGQWYDAAPPWGDFVPFGSASRRDYDLFTLHTRRMAANTLRQTEHEPIQRVVIIEEAWPKRFNLPDDVWARRTPDPKEKHSYYHVIATCTPEGELEARNANWTSILGHNALVNNPRLRNEMLRAQPFLTIENITGNGRQIQQASFEQMAPFR